MDVKYDFKSEANSHKWDKLLIESLERILSEVHLNLTLTDAAAYYIQELILSKCLYPICTKPSTDLEKVEDLIKQKLPPPLNQWAITESRAFLKPQPTQKNNKGISQKKPQFLLPYTKLKNLIYKEFFQISWSDELENVILLIVGCIEFLCVDVVRLIGSYVKNLKSVEVKVEDVKTALSVDKVLLDLFEISRDVNESISQLNTGTENLGPESKTLKYTNLVKMIIAEERQNVRNIQMIIYVFISPLEKLENVPKEKFQSNFFTIHSLHEISTQFLPKLEEIVEFYVNETPLVGDCFLEFAELKSLGPYLTFAQHIAEKKEEYMTNYCRFLASKPVQEYFQKTKKELGCCVAEVYRYVLPRLMFNLVSHAANYYERLDMLLKTSPGDTDRYELEQALSCMKPVLIELNHMAERLPKREVYLRFVPKTIDSAATMRVQELVQNLSGIDEETRKRLYYSVAEIIMEGEWYRISGNDRKSRVVYLLDGWILCCRKKGNQIRVKESFRMREIEIIDRWGVVAGTGFCDLEENGKKTEEMALSFQIVMSETSSSSSNHGKPYERECVFAFETQDDKQKWMVAMLSIHSRGTLERMLDRYIAEEEKKQPLRFPAPDHYCFAEPDEKEGDVNIITDSKSGVSKVKEATLPKLVERLTYHIHADHAYIEDFFTTYRSFCEPMELFNLLNIRFNIPDIEPTEEEKQTYSLVEPPSIRKFRKEYAHPVQSRVLNVLRYWINNHYDDFKKDPGLLAAVDTFIQDVSENKKWKNYCGSIRKSLINQAEEIKKKPEIIHTTDAAKIEWHLAVPGEEASYNLLSLHPLEIARQITLIESEMFRKVTLSELTNFGCCSIKDRDQKRRMFPNVVAWQNFNNRISYWFTYTVLDTPVIEERVALLIRGWEIAQALEELNNFSGVLHVISGLNYSSVSRLKLTHEKLPKETKEQKHQLISKYIDSNLKFYKDALKTTNPPLVPYLGNTFTNVLHIEDSAKTHTSSNLINFSKCRLISSQCRTIMMYQPMPYNLEPESSIQKYLTSQDPVGTHTETEWADKLHAMSLALEPRDSNFTAIKSSSKAERKYNISLYKNPVKKSSQSGGMNVTNKLSKVSASKSGITELVNSSDNKVTTYTRPSVPTSPPVPNNGGRSRSSASHSSHNESTSPNPPSTPKPVMGPEVGLSAFGMTKNFATIGSPIGLVEQQTKQHIQQQHRKQISAVRSMRCRTSSGDNSSSCSLSTCSTTGGSMASMQLQHQPAPTASSITNIAHAHHQHPHPLAPHVSLAASALANSPSPFAHRLSVSSVSPDNQSIGGSSFSMCSSFSCGSPLSAATSNSTLVTETAGGSPGYGCSSSNISTASQSQHSSVSDLTSSPGSCCSSYKMKNQASYFFNYPPPPAQSPGQYGTIDSLSSLASHGYYSASSRMTDSQQSQQSQQHFNPQSSPSSSSPGHMTHPLPRSPSAASKSQGAAPPIPPRKPLNHEQQSVNNPRVSISGSVSGIEDVQTPPGTLSPEHKTSCPSPEKLPPRTPLGMSSGGGGINGSSASHIGLSSLATASSTLPRLGSASGCGSVSTMVESDRLRQLAKSGCNVPGSAYNNTISSININNNNNNNYNNDFYSSPRRSMIESYSANSNFSDVTNNSSPSPIPPMHNGGGAASVGIANHRSHGLPPRLAPRRPDTNSMSSIDHITSSPPPTVHPPEIPARTYKSPAMSAS